MTIASSSSKTRRLALFGLALAFVLCQLWAPSDVAEAKKLKHLKKLKKLGKLAYLLPFQSKKFYAIPFPLPIPVVMKRQRIYTEVPVIPRYVQRPASHYSGGGSQYPDEASQMYSAASEISQQLAAEPAQEALEAAGTKTTKSKSKYKLAKTLVGGGSGGGGSKRKKLVSKLLGGQARLMSPVALLSSHLSKSASSLAPPTSAAPPASSSSGGKSKQSKRQTSGHKKQQQQQEEQQQEQRAQSKAANFNELFQLGHPQQQPAPPRPDYQALYASLAQPNPYALLGHHPHLLGPPAASLFHHAAHFQHPAELMPTASDLGADPLMAASMAARHPAELLEAAAAARSRRLHQASEGSGDDESELEAADEERMAAAESSVSPLVHHLHLLRQQHQAQQQNHLQQQQQQQQQLLQRHLAD